MCVYGRQTQELSRELRLFWRDLDPMELAPRIASGCFLLGGLLILAVDHFSPAVHGQHAMTVIAGIAALIGVVGVTLPWPSFRPQAQLSLPLLAFVLFAAGGVI